MSARKQITVTRDYRYEPDDCARALELLLRKSVNKAARSAPEPDDRNAAKESSKDVCDATGIIPK